MKKTISLLLLCFVLTAVYARQKVHHPPYGSNSKSGKYITLRNFSMYYEEYGKGAPLLMIHGNGGDISNFSNQIPFFSKNYRVIVPDSRAQGKSKDEKDSLSYEMMADDLNELLNRLHIDSCYVIGWSDGGINGLLLAMRHPDKVKKLAVTGANLWPDSTAIDPAIYRLTEKEYFDLRAKPQTAEVKERLKLTRLLYFEPNIKASALRSISCPTLVMGGDHDAILPRHTLEIAKNIPHSYLWLLPWSGHSTPVFRFEEFNTTVARFFRMPFRKIEGTERFH